jgi:hypothetical protein
MTWGRRHFFLSEGRRATDFITLRNPLYSARFEPANLGSKDKDDNRYTTENDKVKFGFVEHIEGVKIQFHVFVTLEVARDKAVGVTLRSSVLQHHCYV